MKDRLWITGRVLHRHRPLRAGNGSACLGRFTGHDGGTIAMTTMTRRRVWLPSQFRFAEPFLSHDANERGGHKVLGRFPGW